MPKDNSINYIELPAKNIEDIKKFYSTVFGWTFTDYGPEYTAFSNSGLEGGFTTDTEAAITNGALIVLYHNNLEELLTTVTENGGIIAKEIFSFPGGRRFHFIDPSGNELAVWSDK